MGIPEYKSLLFSFLHEIYEKCNFFPRSFSLSILQAYYMASERQYRENISNDS